ncbi:MAG: PKD domain-containing protein, partial [Saprospiraceae bacterium]
MKKPLLSTFAFLCFSLSFTAVSAQHCHPSFQFATNGLVATFENQSTADGTITAYSWDFGDGQTSVDQNPIHAYGQDGTYNVCLTITAHEPNCTETFCHHVVVHHLPADTCQAAFLFHQPHPGAPVDFTDQSSSDDVIGSWAWNFGDGSTSSEQNPSHTYAVPGTYLVCLTITDADGGCTSHFCHEVVAHHPPVGVCQASFIFHQPHPGAPVDFTDQSSSDGVIGSWAWDFGDGSTSSEQNPSHTYAVPGTYLVCLTIT